MIFEPSWHGFLFNYIVIYFSLNVNNYLTFKKFGTLFGFTKKCFYLKGFGTLFDSEDYFRILLQFGTVIAFTNYFSKLERVGTIIATRTRAPA